MNKKEIQKLKKKIRRRKKRDNWNIKKTWKWIRRS